MTYLLHIELDRDIEIQIGSLGILHFKQGAYLYIGSAKRNLKSRIARHLSGEKNIFWHIDYFLFSNKTKIKKIWISGRMKECRIAGKLRRQKYDFVNKFGSSDCQCKSHLFFAGKSITGIENLLQRENFRNANRSSF